MPSKALSLQDSSSVTVSQALAWRGFLFPEHGSDEASGLLTGIRNGRFQLRVDKLNIPTLLFLAFQK